MKLPSRGKAIGMLKELGMPDNIFRHTMQVNKIAVFIAEKMRGDGVKVNVDLVDRASLLHDIDKHLTLSNGRHGTEGKKMLEEKGLPELAEFCVTHLYTRILSSSFPSLEHEIVYYADKRVNHDKIVSLDERFKYLRERYGKKPEILRWFDECEPACRKLERKLFEKAGIPPSLEELK